MTLLTRRRGSRRAPKRLEPIHAEIGTAARQMVHNLLVTRDGDVLAGYRIGPLRWDFTGLASKRAVLAGVQDGWAALVSDSRLVHERVTTRPHPVMDWAARLDSRTPAPLPDVHVCDQSKWSRADLLDGRCGCETWNAHLMRQQNIVTGRGMDNKVVFRYFAVGKIDSKTDLRAEALALQRSGTRPSDEVRAVFATEKRTRDTIRSTPGWRGRRMTETEQAWLRRRSAGIGIPSPMIASGDVGGWADDDIGCLADDVRWVEDPWDKTVRVTAFRDGRKIERVVQVLTCTRLADQAYPENGLEPWQAYAARATDANGRPFPVEWSLNGYLLTGEELSASAELDLRTAQHIREGYEQFKETPPEYTDRGIRRAKQVRDQVTTGNPAEASRFIGTINAVVFGEDERDDDGKIVRSAEEVCWERGESFIRMFGGSTLRMQFTVPHGQAYKLAETITGEPFDTKRYRRQIPLDYLAAGAPNVSAAVGDGSGPYVGYTRGANAQPVHHDPHYATAGQRSKGRQQNVWPVIGTLGAGKSVLGGTIIYNAVRRSTLSVVFDPSGPLSRLCYMPELAPYAHDMNVLNSDNGILSPPALVRDPLMIEFERPGRSEDEVRQRWERAMVEARGTRSALVQDAARRCLQDDLYRDPRTMRLFREAARETSWTIDRSLFDLVDSLAKIDDGHACDLVGALNDASEMERLSLLFAPRGQGGDFAHVGSDKILTVISTPGLQRAPDEVPRADWGSEELAANPITHLTMLYATRMLYGKPMARPAVAFFDEAEFMTDGGTGRALLTRLFRDHSKWNMALYLGLKTLPPEATSTMRNYVGGVWGGRMKDEADAREVLSILNVDDKGYARTLLGLSTVVPGEFVHADVDGRVGSVRVDLDYFTRLKEALLTNPTSSTDTDAAWDADEVLG